MQKGRWADFINIFVNPFFQLLILDNSFQLFWILTFLGSMDNGRVYNQNKTVQGGLHFQPHSDGQFDFVASEQSGQKQLVTVVLFDR